MAASSEIFAGFNYGWSLGESGWHTGTDANWLRLGALIFLSVAAVGDTAPPGTPSNGDRYIVGDSATGDWLGEDGKLAVYDGNTATWVFYTPFEGWTARAEDTEQPWLYTSGAWVLQGSTYGQYADDTAAASGGVPVGGYYVNSSTGALSVRLA